MGIQPSILSPKYSLLPKAVGFPKTRYESIHPSTVEMGLRM
jgi:hypothetical protein